jgi:hypothetical protein
MNSTKADNKNISSSELVLYTDPSGQVQIEALLRDKQMWLTQKSMSEAFGVGVPAISKHLANIYEEGELTKEATISILETVQKEGNRKVTREREFYNLDAIISVGYRVNSFQATRFRQWATNVLHEFIQKGFALDDYRLKYGTKFDDEYFDELMERIQEIRTSERKFYQKITDIYATSADYDKDALVTREFFKVVQNKMHWAASEQTAAEIIVGRADAAKPNMGLTSWRGADVRKGDVGIAKNYLTKNELVILNSLTEQYLVFATAQAKQHIVMKMNDWIERLDGFIKLNGKEILTHAGKISHELAIEHANAEYGKFAAARALEPRASDFDAFAENVGKIGK